MCKVVALGKIIINKCMDLDYSVDNPAKIQKLLYFMQKSHLKQYNTPLFKKEAIIAAECGPSIIEVRNHFWTHDIYLEGDEKHDVPLLGLLLDEEIETIDKIIAEHGKKSALELMNLSKKEKAWVKTWGDGSIKNKPILHETMKVEE